MEIVLILAKAVIGGTIVVVFAMVGEALQPRSLGGITSAAPSIAIAGLLIALLASGAPAAANLAMGMTAGAVALIAWCVVGASAVKRLGAVWGSIVATGVWLAVALVLWALVLR
jgi:hypothetical protein